MSEGNMMAEWGHDSHLIAQIQKAPKQACDIINHACMHDWLITSLPMWPCHADAHSSLFR